LAEVAAKAGISTVVVGTAGGQKLATPKAIASYRPPAGVDLLGVGPNLQLNQKPVGIGLSTLKLDLGVVKMRAAPFHGF
jgi:hypothetical protein